MIAKPSAIYCTLFVLGLSWIQNREMDCYIFFAIAAFVDKWGTSSTISEVRNPNYKIIDPLAFVKSPNIKCLVRLFQGFSDNSNLQFSN